MFARRLYCAHTVSTRHPKQRNLKQHRMWQKSVHVAFSGSSKCRKSSWETTNQQNLHQRPQQHAAVIQCCVGFDVCTSLVVCAHTFHTTSKTEKPQTHRMWQNCKRRFFWFIKFQEKHVENDKSTKSAPTAPTARWYYTTLHRF